MADARLEIADGVAVITLDRPEKLNAFTGAMGRIWGEAYAQCDADDAVRAVVVTGAGRAFCAGADMSPEIFAAPTDAEPDSDAAPPSGEGGGAFTSSPVRPPAFEVRKPVIAAINGHAIGIGLTLAMQADIRLVANEAKLSFANVRRGVMPDAHSHWTVPRAIGFARTAELFLTGRQVLGSEAVEWGLASQALPAEEVLPTALAMAQDIVVNVAPVSAAVVKRLLWRSPTPDAEQTDRLETELHRVLMGASDAREGAVAWLERREPQWQGNVDEDLPDWL
jgi:enoyl-CoA hydratase/carnithine racemase